MEPEQFRLFSRVAEPEQYGDGGSSGFLRPRRPASKWEFLLTLFQISRTAISVAGTIGLLRCLHETITMGGQDSSTVLVTDVARGCVRAVTGPIVFVRVGFDGKQRRSGAR